MTEIELGEWQPEIEGDVDWELEQEAAVEEYPAVVEEDEAHGLER